MRRFVRREDTCGPVEVVAALVCAGQRSVTGGGRSGERLSRAYRIFRSIDRGLDGGACQSRVTLVAVTLRLTWFSRQASRQIAASTLARRALWSLRARNRPPQTPGRPAPPCPPPRLPPPPRAPP